MAWHERTSASQIVREILEDYRKDPGSFRSLPDMEGAPSGTLTVYVPSGPWLETRDVAYTHGRMPVSVVIRKGLRARMEAGYIPAKA